LVCWPFLLPYVPLCTAFRGGLQLFFFPLVLSLLHLFYFVSSRFRILADDSLAWTCKKMVVFFFCLTRCCVNFVAGSLFHFCRSALLVELVLGFCCLCGCCLFCLFPSPLFFFFCAWFCAVLAGAGFCVCKTFCFFLFCV